MGRTRNLLVFLGLILFTLSAFDCHVTADVIPSENECRPYIEKAIHELKNVEATGTENDDNSIEENGSIENEAAPEVGNEGDENDTVEDDKNESNEAGKSDDDQSDDDTPSQENQTEENASQEDAAQDNTAEDLNDESVSNQQDDSKEDGVDDKDDDKASVEEKADEDNDSQEKTEGEGENGADADSKEQNDDAKDVDDDSKDADDNSKENSTTEDDNASVENAEEDLANDSAQTEENQAQDQDVPEEAESEQANDGSNEDLTEKSSDDSVDDEKADESGEENENQTAETVEETSNEDATTEANDNSTEASAENDTKEDANENSAEETVRSKRSIPDEANDGKSDEQDDSKQDNDNDSKETANEVSSENDSKENDETDSAAQESQENKEENATDSGEDTQSGEDNQSGETKEGVEEESDEADEEEEKESMPEEDLTMEFEIPKNLRPRGHVSDLLGLDEESSIKETALKQTGDVVLKELKRIFDNAIKPLELMYKYRDLSNRHFGDPEIFSKPLILFMGPWSGGKSTILNYLTENEYTPNSIRSGAEPSPAYFNILMHGDQPEVLDGTQLAADWTFSGLQKFGQGLMDRLRGQKLPNKLLERVNIVEIPGILEVRKQVSKYFPFNDACQWFIDRADIIFLVYDPSKLDVGPETEAILDQLKGREYQTKILLNKADQVKPEELLRVQGALIWNISPLMSSAQPPVMYTVSLWSHPFENGAPIRLLQAQERAFLSDLREAIDKRIENKIASARRFAVRIRNHAKMVDCYLTTYYNQKGLFSNKKQVADKIIEHPQNYNIYEGLSTLTNISRYDLPDPEVYMDFFRLNPLYEFKKLSDTCTYFKGCPINKLDIAIAYELPELVGKYKKLLEQNLIQARKEYDENCNQTEPEPPIKIINSR